VTSPAPQAVYQSIRYGNTFAYNIKNLTPNTNFLVRLHFNELYWTSAGQRVFNVAINGNQVLSNYDIFADAGGENIAVIKSFNTTSDSNGKISIQFTTVTDNAMVNGIELLAQ
jgi:malectin (di-glucose binding ER protein)